MIDRQGRKIDYLRVSVTDRCNLRCIYCMPKGCKEWIPHDDIMRYEEIQRACRLFAEEGVETIRLTGGEPLTRKGITDLISEINSIKNIRRIAMTTNGLLLKGRCQELKKAGLTDVNISLNSLDKDKYRRITGVDCLLDVREVIDEALETFDCVKINAVMIAGENEEELVALASLAKDRELNVRFIEMMPIGEGKGFSLLTREMAMGRLTAEYGPGAMLDKALGSGPANYYKFKDFKGKVGFINPMSSCFCDSCNRMRLTSVGAIKPCLHQERTFDLKGPMRAGASDDALRAIIRQATGEKPKGYDFEDDSTVNKKKMFQIGG